MPCFDGSIFSCALGMTTSLRISLPDRFLIEQESAALPVLYLLHGLSDDHTAWSRRTSVERYAESAGIAVVMPEVQRSFYTDMVYGLRYFTYIAEELPALCRRLFPLSERREATFIAGNSLGGYGALKAALRFPERFGAAASFSGAVDVKKRFDAHRGEFQAINNGRLKPEDDLFVLSEQIDPAASPRLFMTCGLSDFLLTDNRQLRDRMISRGLPLSYDEQEGGHDWEYWDNRIGELIPRLIG